MSQEPPFKLQTQPQESDQHEQPTGELTELTDAVVGELPILETSRQSSSGQNLKILHRLEEIMSNERLSNHDQAMIKQLLQALKAELLNEASSKSPGLFRKVTNISDFLKDVERTLMAPEGHADKRCERTEHEVSASASNTHLKRGSGNTNLDPESSGNGGFHNESPVHSRGFASDIERLHDDWIKRGSKQFEGAGSSMVALRPKEAPSGKITPGGVQHEKDTVKESDEQDDEIMEFESDDETQSQSDEEKSGSGESDDLLGSYMPIGFQPALPYNPRLEPGIWTVDQGYSSSLNPDVTWDMIDANVRATKKAARGLAKELGRLSQGQMPYDIEEEGGEEDADADADADTEVEADADADADMVGGLSAWEFEKAGLGNFVTPAEVEQQEALLQVFEINDSEKHHEFMIGSIQPRVLATSGVSGSAAKHEQFEEGKKAIRKEEEEDFDMLDEDEQLERVLALSLEELKQKDTGASAGKGKQRAE